MSAELIAFISARLDEDEAAARKVIEETRHCNRCDRLASGHWTVSQWGVQDAGSEATIVYDEEQPAVLGHIARHDPARALREITARRGLAAKACNIAQYAASDDWRLEDLAQQALQAIAVAWNDHPAYKAEWAP